MPRVGDRVFVGDECVGTVERTFLCTWGHRRGRLHSVQVSGMDVIFRRIRVPGILYWSHGRNQWVNKLHPDVRYTFEEERMLT